MSITKRIIPCLDIMNGKTVKGTNFQNLKNAGDPLELAMKYENEGADELIFLDITATHSNSSLLTDLVQRLSKILTIPFTVGGGISSISQVYSLLRNGADKITINSSAVMNPSFIKTLAEEFGSQCITVAIDAKQVQGNWNVFIQGGRKNTLKDLFQWIDEIESQGAGELLFTSMDHDGTNMGYAVETLKAISKQSQLPLIASGGAGTFKHFQEVFQQGHVDAALAASVFHFKQIEIPILKSYLSEQNINVRLT